MPLRVCVAERPRPRNRRSVAKSGRWRREDGVATIERERDQRGYPRPPSGSRGGRVSSNLSIENWRFGEVL